MKKENMCCECRYSFVNEKDIWTCLNRLNKAKTALLQIKPLKKECKRFNFSW
jgi:hypothetical protein